MGSSHVPWHLTLEYRKLQSFVRLERNPDVLRRRAESEDRLDRFLQMKTDAGEKP